MSCSPITFSKLKIFIFFNENILTMFVSFFIYKGSADNSRKHVYIASQNHKASDS